MSNKSALATMGKEVQLQHTKAHDDGKGIHSMIFEAHNIFSGLIYYLLYCILFQMLVLKRLSISYD
jgi:hypothetical protein